MNNGKVVIPVCCGRPETLYDWGEFGYWFHCEECASPDSLIPIEDCTRIDSIFKPQEETQAKL